MTLKLGALRDSIAIRLAAMFAMAALVVFSLIGIALYSVLSHELNRQQIDTLNARADVLHSLVRNAATPDRWRVVQGKLAGLTPGAWEFRFWVLSPDSTFTYGKPPRRMDGKSAFRDGLAMVVLDEGGNQRPVRALIRTIAANGERPDVQLMVGIDAAPMIHTLRLFALALIGLSALGVLLVALLGYWIARLGLGPVQRLSDSANALSPRRLSQRLEVSAASPMPHELTGLAVSFNGALDRLEGAYKQLEAFNADVAHELRTPLTNLIGQTQVALSRERSKAELEDVLQSNLEELDRFRTIVNDMLFLARADQGEMATSLRRTLLAEEVAKTADFLEFLLDEAGVSVRIDGEVHGWIDSSLFRRALTNLLHNAAQHSQPDAVIDVSLSRMGDQVRIAVSNPGPHIAPEHLDKLFDRFYRIDPSRRNSGDSHGLGLAIVKAIAQMHGGAVFADSADGSTTIGFTIADAGHSAV
ncbi:MAG: heavy metal sensor histidine kinase [Pseudomonadota bacterium]